MIGRWTMIAGLSLWASVASALPLRADDEAPPTHLRGVVAGIEGGKVTMTTLDGTKMIVRIAPDAKVLVASRASLADVKPGTHVGIANVGPIGLQDALEVHVYADAGLAGIGGQKRWDLARSSRMTNGTVSAKSESYDGQNLTVTFKGGESTIQVRPNTPVIRLTAGSVADVTTGTAVFVSEGEAQPDGSVLAESVVVGRNGLKVPL